MYRGHSSLYIKSPIIHYNMNTFIIAEAGSNHNKQFEQALSLIDVAKESGVNAVKFQTYSSESLYCINTPNFANYTNINKLIKNIELPREWQADLKKYCDKNDIEFMSTPFDEKAVEELIDIGVNRLKISGFESTDLRFVEMVCSAKLPIIVSLGIGSSFKLIYNILDIAHKYDIQDITFLHCNNAYPTPPDDSNLNTIKALSLDSRYKCGYSDHTLSTLTPALAVMAGATVIEKHFTLSKRLSGPDHSFALEPTELKQMVDYIKFTERCMGNKLEKITSSEEQFSSAMRSVVTKDNLNVGDILAPTNITTKRPFLDGAIPSSEYFNVLGKPIKRNIQQDCHIFTNDI
jgi:N,N'-diacetyllegionaminate synthase